VASLTLKGITKRFGGVEVLSGLDLHVEDGRFCVLLGPSGCGKSTLLTIVAGLVPQDEGSVLLDGRPVDRLAPRDRDVAMVFQNYALYPHMTVAENLGFGLRMRRVAKSAIRERVEETARLLGISELLGRKPRELSGGQQQRVAMGRALVRRPRLFLLDEPLSNLDARLRSSVRLELKRLHQQTRGTILYVTHDQVEAMTLGDQVVVMRGGVIHQIDTPEAVYARPADRFVATFLGSPEMNLYRGRLVRRQGRTFFEGAAFSLALHDLRPDLADEEVELGIRPEDVAVGAEKSPAIRAVVEMTSNVGSETHVHALLGQERLTLKTSVHTDLRAGSPVLVDFPLDRVHIFHNGKRV